MDMVAASEILARSTTLTSVGWIGYIIIGAIAGWIAGKIVKGGGSGIVMNIVIGIVGALIGGFLFTAAGQKGLDDLSIWSIFVAFVGASLLLLVLGALTGRKGR